MLQHKWEKEKEQWQYAHWHCGDFTLLRRCLEATPSQWNF